MPLATAQALGSTNAAVAYAVDKLMTVGTSAVTAIGTVNELVDGIYYMTGTPGATTWTTPTGAAIWAGVLGARIGMTFHFVLANSTDNTCTFTAGATGVTLVGTATVATGKARLFIGQLTAADTVVISCIE